MLYRRRLEIHLSRTPFASSSPLTIALFARDGTPNPCCKQHAIFFTKDGRDFVSPRFTRTRGAFFRFLVSARRSIYRDRFFDKYMRKREGTRCRGIVRKNKENKRKIKNSYCAHLLSESVLFIINRAGYFSSFFFSPSNIIIAQKFDLPSTCVTSINKYSTNES